LGEMVGGVARGLLLPLLARHPRVLDAWVKKNSVALQNEFELTAQTSSDRGSPYTALPINGPLGEVVVPSPDSLRRHFQADRSFTQIIGQGGAGKTKLAIQIGRWLSAGELTSHPAGALFIDEEFTDLFTVAQAKLQAALIDTALPP